MERSYKVEPAETLGDCKLYQAQAELRAMSEPPAVYSDVLGGVKMNKAMATAVLGTLVAGDRDYWHGKHDDMAQYSAETVALAGCLGVDLGDYV